MTTSDTGFAREGSMWAILFRVLFAVLGVHAVIMTGVSSWAMIRLVDHESRVGIVEKVVESHDAWIRGREDMIPTARMERWMDGVDNKLDSMQESVSDIRVSIAKSEPKSP